MLHAMTSPSTFTLCFLTKQIYILIVLSLIPVVVLSLSQTSGQFQMALTTICLKYLLQNVVIKRKQSVFKDIVNSFKINDMPQIFYF